MKIFSKIGRRSLVIYLSLIACLPIDAKKPAYKPFVLPDLPYAECALEPFIDTETMHLHHKKHHQKYIDNLNAAVRKDARLYNKTVEELVKEWPQIREDIRTEIRNNAGGHLNHSLFWLWMTPTKTTPSENFAAQITKYFGSVKKFKESFGNAASKVFGSGWAWLCLTSQGKLIIKTTPNQDNPLTEGLLPIFGLDVWEHAYYLKYNNRRADYLEAWWNVVNWPQVEKLYDIYMSTLSVQRSQVVQ